MKKRLPSAQKDRVGAKETNARKRKGQAEGTLHIRKCPLRHFKEFVMMVGCDEFVVNRINYGGNYNEIII